MFCSHTKTVSREFWKKYNAEDIYVLWTDIWAPSLVCTHTPLSLVISNILITAAIRFSYLSRLSKPGDNLSECILRLTQLA